MDGLADIGTALQAARKAHGLTQEQLAELAGISERTLRSIEVGRGNPSFSALSALAHVLGMKISVSSE